MRNRVYAISLCVRSLLIAISICVIVITSNAPTRADDGYVEIGGSKAGEIYSLYLPSLEDRGEYISCWVKITNLTGDLAKPINKKKPSYKMQLVAVANNTKQYQLLSAVTYDQNGSTLDSFSSQYSPTNWSYCIPGSVAEVIWNAITDANFYNYLERNRIEDF